MNDGRERIFCFIRSEAAVIFSSLKLVILITKGLIRDQNTRRMAMFVVLLVALVMLFAGSTFLSRPLAERPMLLLIFWAVCAWLTFSAALLALYDMLMLRVAAARERRRLKKEILEKSDDSH